MNTVARQYLYSSNNPWERYGGSKWDRTPFAGMRNAEVEMALDEADRKGEDIPFTIPDGDLDTWVGL